MNTTVNNTTTNPNEIIDFVVVTICTETGKVISSPHWEVSITNKNKLIAEATARHVQCIGHGSAETYVLPLSAF